MTRSEFVDKMNNGIYFKRGENYRKDNLCWTCSSNDVDNDIHVGLLKNDVILVCLDLSAITLDRAYNLQDLAYLEGHELIYSRDSTLHIELGKSWEK